MSSPPSPSEPYGVTSIVRGILDYFLNNNQSQLKVDYTTYVHPRRQVVEDYNTGVEPRRPITEDYQPHPTKHEKILAITLKRRDSGISMSCTSSHDEIENELYDISNVKGDKLVVEDPTGSVYDDESVSCQRVLIKDTPIGSTGDVASISSQMILTKDTTTGSAGDDESVPFQRVPTNDKVELPIKSEPPKHIKLLLRAYKYYCEFHREAEEHFFISVQEMVNHLLDTHHLLTISDSNHQGNHDIMNETRMSCDEQIRSLTEHFILASQKHINVKEKKSNPKSQYHRVSVSRNGFGSSIGGITRSTHQNYQSKLNNGINHGANFGSISKYHRSYNHPINSHENHTNTTPNRTSLSSFTPKLPSQTQSHHHPTTQSSKTPSNFEKLFTTTNPDSFKLPSTSHLTPIPQLNLINPTYQATNTVVTRSSFNPTRPSTIPRSRTTSSIPRFIPRSHIIIPTSRPTELLHPDRKLSPQSDNLPPFSSSQSTPPQTYLPSPRLQLTTCLKPNSTTTTNLLLLQTQPHLSNQTRSVSFHI